MNAERLLAHYEKIADAPDAIFRLRRFILDLAMRGKLVPQDQNDEPAVELLKRIFAEKARLVKAGEIRGRNRENPDVAEPPFTLPRNWTWTAFGNVHELIRGVTYSKSDVSEVPGAEFVPVLRANNIGVALTHEEPVYVKEHCVSADQFLKSGDFMIALSSGSKNLVGKAAFVPEDYREAFGGFCGVIRLFDQSLQGIVRVYLQSNLYRESIAEGSRGIGINNLKKETISNLFFPLPPLAEQHLIVAKVDELNGLCDRLEVARAEREAARDRLAAASLARLNAPDPRTFQSDAQFVLNTLPALTTRADHIKQLRQIILSLAVRGKLVTQDPNDEPASELLGRIIQTKRQMVASKALRKVKELEPVSEHEIKFDLPSQWVATRLGTVYDVRDGTHDTPKYVDVGYPLITSKNLSSGQLSFANIKFISEQDHRQISERSAVQRDDILLAMIGSIGNPVVVDTDRPFSIKNVALLKYYDRALSDPGYLCLFLQYAADEMRQLAAGGLQPFVSLGFLRSYPVALPPLSEQHRIVAKVSQLMALCEQLEASLDATAASRRHLLDALIAEVLVPADAQEIGAVA